MLDVLDRHFEYRLYPRQFFLLEFQHGGTVGLVLEPQVNIHIDDIPGFLPDNLLLPCFRHASDSDVSILDLCPFLLEIGSEEIVLADRFAVFKRTVLAEQAVPHGILGLLVNLHIIIGHAVLF